MGKWIKTTVTSFMVFIPVISVLLFLAANGMPVFKEAFWSFEGLFIVYAFIFYNVFLLYWKWIKMLMDFLIPLMTLDWGWLVLAIERNLFWVFAFFAFLVLTKEPSNTWMNFLMLCGFVFGFVALFAWLGLFFIPFELVIPLMVGLHWFLKGTRFEHHFDGIICWAFILFPVIWFFLAAWLFRSSSRRLFFFFFRNFLFWHSFVHQP